MFIRKNYPSVNIFVEGKRKVFIRKNYPSVNIFIGEKGKVLSRKYYPHSYYHHKREGKGVY